jgi:hypothetical protein
MPATKIPASVVAGDVIERGRDVLRGNFPSGAGQEG